MAGIIHALWVLANPAVGSLCLQRPLTGRRGGRCWLEPDHDGDHMDVRGVRFQA